MSFLVCLQAGCGVEVRGWWGNVFVWPRKPGDWAGWWGTSVSARLEDPTKSDGDTFILFQETARRSRKVVVRAVCCSEDSQDERGEVSTSSHRPAPVIIISLPDRHHSGLDYPPILLALCHKLGEN